MGDRDSGLIGVGLFELCGFFGVALVFDFGPFFAGDEDLASLAALVFADDTGFVHLVDEA